MPRVITNKITADWLTKSPRNRLSYLVNNNPNAVIAFLQLKGAVIADLNHDGTISTDELFSAIETYVKAQYGGLNAIQKFLDEAGRSIPHNDNAPRKWNIYL